MARIFIAPLAATVALTCLVAGMILAAPDAARSTNSEVAVASTGFNHVGTNATARPEPAYVPAFLTMIDIERLMAVNDPPGEDAMPRRSYIGVFVPAIDFEGAFGSVTQARRANTPPTREKLRNAGWKRILGPSHAGSRHAGPGQARAQATRRYLNALRNGRARIIARGSDPR
jgi:hypothetical protein